MENIYAVIRAFPYDAAVDFYYGLEGAIKMAKSWEGYPGITAVTVTKAAIDDDGLLCGASNKDDIVYHWEEKECSK